MIQTAAVDGSVHLRPDGRECGYLGAPPICNKCGSLLELEPIEPPPRRANPYAAIAAILLLAALSWLPFFGGCW